MAAQYRMEMRGMSECAARRPSPSANDSWYFLLTTPETIVGIVDVVSI